MKFITVTTPKTRNEVKINIDHISHIINQPGNYPHHEDTQSTIVTTSGLIDCIETIPEILSQIPKNV